MSCSNCPKDLSKRKTAWILETAKRGGEDVRTRWVCTQKCGEALAKSDGANIRRLERAAF